MALIFMKKEHKKYYLDKRCNFLVMGNRISRNLQTTYQRVRLEGQMRGQPTALDKHLNQRTLAMGKKDTGFTMK